MTKSVLVTCGATVSFPGLIDAVINEDVLAKLKSLHYDRILVQFGKGYQDQFERKLRTLVPVIEKANGEVNDIEGCEGLLVAELNGFKVYGFEFSYSIESIIENQIDLVISHAGTGSILDSLRLEKPLIVVVNDTLMDNHQQLIADKFEQQGLLWSIHARAQELLAVLARTCLLYTSPLLLAAACL